MALVRFTDGSSGSVSFEDGDDGMRDSDPGMTRDERRESLREWAKLLQKGHPLSKLGSKSLAKELIEELDEADLTKEDTA